MIYIDKPLLVASSDGNAKRLATISFSKIVRKKMEPFVIVGVQSSTLNIDMHGIQNTKLLNCEMLVTNKYASIRISQRIPVKKRSSNRFIYKHRNTQIPSTIYAVDQMV